MLKVGLVGVGGISGAHIPVWDAMEGAVLTALCDARESQLAPYADRHCYTDFSEMLEKEPLDILDICLPTEFHTDCAVCAMERGIHVLCEKPVSFHEEDVDRLTTAAEKNHVHFMVAQVLRFWPEYVWLKSVYEKETYGKLLSGTMSRLSQIPQWSFQNWMSDKKRSGLVPFDLHIHDLDFLVHAFGAPKNSTVRRSCRPDQDYLCAVYDFDGFSVCTEAAWYAAPYPFSASFRFQFEKALVVYQNGVCTVYNAADGSVSTLSPSSDLNTDAISIPKSDGYAAEIQYFADCVRQNKTPDKVPPAELKTVIRLLKELG